MWALPMCACSCLPGDAATAVEVAAPGLCDERSVETGGWSRLHKCVDAACIWLSAHVYVCVCCSSYWYKRRPGLRLVMSSLRTT